MDWKAVLQVTATHCCVCRRALTDAESVEQGIGPICSSRYYNPLFVPTDDQVLNALGWLTTLAMQNILPGVLYETIRAYQNDARKACNILIYWASAHYEDREKVLGCAQVVRAFGYIELADKLESDRSQVHLFPDPNNGSQYIIRISRPSVSLKTDLTRLTSAAYTGREDHKEVFTFPKDKLAQVETIIGAYFGGELAATKAGCFGAPQNGVVKIPKRSMSEVYALRNPGQSNKLCQAAQFGGKGVVEIEDHDTQNIRFRSPYNGGWLAEFKKVIPKRDTRWSGSYWIVAKCHLQVVKNLAERFYGVKF